MKKVILISSFLIVCFYSVSYSQFSNNYIPISQSFLTVPEELNWDYSNQANIIIGAETDLSKEEATAFYANVFSTKKELLTNGQIYYNDILSDYVQKVVSELLKSNPDLKSKVKIYVSRYSSANAMTFPDGTIIVNAGLLARLENESQLAFILGHEIAHFEKRHVIKEMVKINQIKNEDKKSSMEVNTFRKMQYSRESEFEADARGLQLMIASGFDARESLSALDILDDTLYRYPGLLDQLINGLSSENIKIDSSFFSSKKAQLSKSKNNIVFNSSSEDLYNTHPDMSKRISALREMMNIADYKSDAKNKNIIFDEKRISEIREQSLFEMLTNMHNQANYNLSLYFCFGLLSSYPDNSYLKLMIVKNLYWASYYKELNNVEATFADGVFETTSSLDLLNMFLLNISHNDLKKITFEYSKKHLETMKSNDEYFLYYAMASEIYLGKEPASMIYNQHLLKFPESKYYLFVNNKTK